MINPKALVAKTRFFLEKEFVEKGDINKKIDLDEIIEPSLHEPSGTMKVISEASSNVEEENNVDYNDDGLGDANENVRAKRVSNQTKWFGDPVLTVMLMEHDEPLLSTVGFFSCRQCWASKSRGL
jgi:hypothetical protein